MKQTDVIKAHKFSNNNKPELEKDTICGCFACLEIFSPSEIDNWYFYDNDCDNRGTAFCPYCDIDTVIGESSGYPITKEFLRSMNNYWIKSGVGISLSTPYGNIKLQLDGKDVSFNYRCIDNGKQFSDADATYRILFDYKSDRKNHILRLILENCSVNGEAETGERLEAASFYVDDGKITLGCEASFGDYIDYGYDFDGCLIKNGIEISLMPTTKSQTFKFGICWLQSCTEENEVQTWFGADPFYE